MDFIESGKLATDAVKFLVLDEADRLLDKGSQELVLKLFSKLPKAATGTQRLQVHALTVWDHTPARGCYAVVVCWSESCPGPSHQHLCSSYKQSLQQWEGADYGRQHSALPVADVCCTVCVLIQA